VLTVKLLAGISAIKTPVLSTRRFSDKTLRPPLFVCLKPFILCPGSRIFIIRHRLRFQMEYKVAVWMS